MDLRRLRAGELICAAGGVALLVSLWLPWYSPHSLSGWEALAALDVLLALLAAAAVALPIVTAALRVPAVPLVFSVFVCLGGIVGVILVLLRVLALPDGAEGRDWGLWVALAAALGIVAGTLLAMRDERLSPSAPQPTIETFPAPRP
jgi:hypothetical protein